MSARTPIEDRPIDLESHLRACRFFARQPETFSKLSDQEISNFFYDFYHSLKNCLEEKRVDFKPPSSPFPAPTRFRIPRARVRTPSPAPPGAYPVGSPEPPKILTTQPTFPLSEPSSADSQEDPRAPPARFLVPLPGDSDEITQQRRRQYIKGGNENTRGISPSQDSYDRLYQEGGERRLVNLQGRVEDLALQAGKGIEPEIEEELRERLAAQEAGFEAQRAQIDLLRGTPVPRQGPVRISESEGRAIWEIKKIGSFGRNP